MKMELDIKKIELKSKTKLLKFMNILLRFTGQNIFYDDIYSIVVTYVLTFMCFIIIILGVINPIYEPNMNTVTHFIDLFGPYYQVS